MPPSFDARSLAGRSLTSVFTAVADGSDWDIAQPRPDGSVSFDRHVEEMIAPAELAAAGTAATRHP